MFVVCFTVDERCDMELDETDPTIWLKLEAATNDYIENNSSAFKQVCEKLLQNYKDGKIPDILNSPQFLKPRRLNIGTIGLLHEILFFLFLINCCIQ